ncbi:ATP-binding protein [Acidothermaceae bacterium B102]|nr:ATP-binding protein [Acidothermaceae bacterium B102]
MVHAPQPPMTTTRSRVPTTAAGCEIAIVLVFLGVRLLNVVQLVIAAIWGLPLSTRPWLDATCMAVFALTSLYIGVVVVRRGQYRDWRLVVMDGSVACAIALLQADFTRPADRINSWGGWAFPVAITAASGAGIALRKVSTTTLATAAISACYLTPTLLATHNPSQRLTVIVNGLAIGAFAAVSLVVARFLRRLGADSDAARAWAAEAARSAELDRHRLLLHDQETVLRLLSEPVLDATLARLLQKQAASGASQIRSFLTGDGMPDTGEATLAATVRRAALQFTDLPMTISTDLADEVPLSAETAAPLGQAIVTLLHNVRRHAAATSVVVHAAGDVDDGWEVSVHDNGCGFDPATTPPGFGLGTQVHRALAPHHIEAHLSAAAGDGTLVILRFSPAEAA